MALILADRVAETSATTGTGTLSLAGASAQMQTFVAGIGSTNTCYYCIKDGNGNDWEVGLGTVTSGSPDTLARTTVFASTNSGSKISLSAHTHTVFCTVPANHTARSIDLDNGFGSTQGQILYRGASSWTVLAPGTTGDFLKTNGAGANPAWATPSGGGGGGSGLYSASLSTVPTSASTGLTTWLNQGGASVANTAAGVTITAPASAGDQLRCRTKAVPATPYTVTVLLAISATGQNYQNVNIGWYNGTDKLHTIGLAYNSSISGGWGYEVIKWASASSFSADDVPISHFGFGPHWFQISDDGTNAIFRISGDGTNFIPVFSVAKASGYLGGSGYSNIVFCVDRNNSTGSTDAAGTLMSYTES